MAIDKIGTSSIADDAVTVGKLAPSLDLRGEEFLFLG